MDLLSSCLLGRSLDKSSEEDVTLLGVGEALAVEDLEFSVLLDKSEDDDRVLGERGPGEWRERS